MKAAEWYSPGGERAWRSEFKVGSRLDALDLQDKWFIAEVVDVKPGQILIRYYTWSPKWDVWVSTMSEKIAPYKAHTQYAADGEANKLGVPRYFKEENETITCREILDLSSVLIDSHSAASAVPNLGSPQRNTAQVGNGALAARAGLGSAISVEPLAAAHRDRDGSLVLHRASREPPLQRELESEAEPEEEEEYEDDECDYDDAAPAPHMSAAAAVAALVHPGASASAASAAPPHSALVAALARHAQLGQLGAGLGLSEFARDAFMAGAFGALPPFNAPVVADALSLGDALALGLGSPRSPALSAFALPDELSASELVAADSGLTGSGTSLLAAASSGGGGSLLPLSSPYVDLAL